MVDSSFIDDDVDSKSSDSKVGSIMGSITLGGVSWRELDSSSDKSTLERLKYSFSFKDD